MKIRSKLSLGLCVMVSLAGTMAYLSVSRSWSLLQKTIISDVLLHAQKSQKQIHQEMEQRIQELQRLASSHFILDRVVASNKEFEKLPDVNTYIEAIDRDWIAKKETPFIETVLTTRLSQYLQAEMAFYQRAYQYSLFGEVFITNKYGAVIAASGRTSDYKQSDEDWFHQGWRSASYWVGPPEYDESSGIIAIDSVIPLHDSAKKPIGVLKAVLNMSYVQKIVEAIQHQSPYQSLQTYFVDANGVLLFSDIDSQLKETGEDVPLKDFGTPLSFYQDLLRHIPSGEGSFLDKENKTLFVLARFGDFDFLHDLGWSLVVRLSTKELFVPVKALTKDLILICSVIFILSAFFSAWLALSFYKPVKQLKKAVILFGQGKLEQPIKKISKDELGELAVAFNQMAADLNLLKKDLEGRVAERTEQLERREKFTRLIIETANDAFVSMDAQGLITEWSKRAKEMFGWSHEEVLGKSLAQTVIPAKGRESRWKELLKTVEWDSSNKRIEMMALHRDGHEFPIELSIWSVWEGKSCSFHGFIRDISEKKQLQEQFMQSQKMEGIGRLAGGVAHDFNNQLTAIIGYGQLLLDSLPEKDPKRSIVQEVLNAANRSAKLTHQLLTFSRRGMIHPKRVNLNEVVFHLDHMLRRLVSENIELSVIPEETLWTVDIDPSQVEHILVNLVVNARDAMPQGGKIIIETKNIELDEGYTLRHMDFLPGEYVLLAVSDTGMGMSKEVQSHLFEPFFTTKEKGKGTGLGLAMCYGIIRQNKGYVLVYSEKGIGSTFKIYLPRVKEAAQALSQPKEETKPVLLHGDETILVVEDEVSVRKMVVQILKNQGYRVLEASNGEEALRVAKNHKESIDLLFTDVVMPQMGGLELFEKMRHDFPAMKVLFTSGYTDEAIVETGKLRHGVDFIHKPFSTAAVSIKIREILDSEKKKAA